MKLAWFVSSFQKKRIESSVLPYFLKTKLWLFSHKQLHRIFTPIKAVEAALHRRRTSWQLGAAAVTPVRTTPGARRGGGGKGGWTASRMLGGPHWHLSKSTHEPRLPSSWRPNLCGASELKRLLPAAGLFFKKYIFFNCFFFCSPVLLPLQQLCARRYRDASFVHGEKQEGAQLPPAPQPGGRLQQAGHHPATHLLRLVHCKIKHQSKFPFPARTTQRFNKKMTAWEISVLQCASA